MPSYGAAHSAQNSTPLTPIATRFMIPPMLCLAVSMPKTPKGHKRRADVVSNAVHVMRVATGEISESATTDDGKSKAAVELGSKGGKARAEKLSARKRAEIAKRAARARWRS